MTEIEKTFISIKDAVFAANNILVIVHQKPDGDAIGSCLALGKYLETLKKQHTLYHTGSKPDYLLYVSDYQNITNDETVFKKEKFDLIIVLDSGDLSYAGVEDEIKKITYPYTLVNIDHHASNTFFGNINLVLDQASSTAEIVFNLLETTGFRVDKPVADLLILGIYSDTQILTNLATTPETVSVVSRLLSRGAQIKPIIKNLETKNFPILKLWAKALSRIEKNEKYNLIYTVILQSDLKECGLEQNDTGGIANFFNSVSGKGINMILTEMDDGTVKGSMRTTSDKYEVDKLAKLFGGGGHKKAAGFRVKGKLQETDTGWKII